MLIVDKTTGAQLSAVEFNQIPDEIENVISKSGQTPSAADSTQLSKGIYTYASNSTFYIDTGAANAYDIDSQPSVDTFGGNTNGKLVRFVPLFSNTGASTIDVNNAGIVALEDVSGNPLVGGEIIAGREVIATFFTASGEYRILTNALTTDLEVNNAITDSGQTPTPADDTQLSIAFTNFSSTGSFYATDGAANNAYNVIAVAPHKDPFPVGVLKDGFEVRFKADFTNTTTTPTLQIPNQAAIAMRDYNGNLILPGAIQLNSFITCFFHFATTTFRLGSSNTLIAATQSYSLKNLFINPRFIINQRDQASVAGIGTYNIDRWRNGKNGSSNAISQISQTTGGISIPVNGSAEQEMETPNLAGKKITISAINVGGSGVQVRVRGANPATAEFGPFSLPATLIVDGTITDNMVIEFEEVGGATLTMASVQVEINDHATDFDYRDTSVDLGMCIKYFEALSGGPDSTNSVYGVGFVDGDSSPPTADSAGLVIYYAQKRVRPTISTNGTISNFKASELGFNVTPIRSLDSFFAGGPRGMQAADMSLGWPGGEFNSGAPVLVRSENSASLFIDAELKNP